MRTGKSICVAVALTMFTIGCTIENPDGVKSQTEKQITISAYRADLPETKTRRDESDGSVLWTPGDAISLFYGSGTNGGNRFVSTSVAPSKVTNFTGTIGVITGGADVSVEDTYFWGLYPYDAAASCDGSSVITTLPNTQVATPSTFASNLFPSLGRSQGLSMGFYNICGGVRFTVTKEGLKQVTLKAIGGEKLTGKARIGFENGVPKVLEITDGSDEITLTAPDGKFLEVGKYYYFITFPQALSQGIRMKFETFTEEGTFERQTSNLTIKRSIFGTLNNVDQNVAYAKKTGSIPIEDAAFKTWLVQHGFDTNSDGEISYAEAETYEQIWIGNSEDWNIRSLQGIECMPNLTHLFCAGAWRDPLMVDLPEHYYISPNRDNYTCGPIGTLQKIDISNNHKLVYLNISHCEALGDMMGEIDLSNNLELEELYICYNGLKYPNISHLNKLRVFETRGNRGQVPDFSQFTTLENIEISNPRDDHSYSVDISNCYNLERLIIENTTGSITGIAQNTKLKELWLRNWDNTSYHADLPATVRDALPLLTELEVFNCENMKLGSLNVSNNTKLTRLVCRNNNLSQLDLSANPNLINLDYAANNIHSLDLTSFPNLEWLYVDGNPLESIDISNNNRLIYFDCSYTGLSELDLTKNTQLKALRCVNNNFISLDLSKNTNLEMVDCRNNNLTSLNVSQNTRLGDAYWGGELGLYCSQRNNALGVNLLETLYIAEGQGIPFITINRDTTHIPSSTTIQVVPVGGGGEGTGNDNWN